MTNFHKYQATGNDFIFYDNRFTKIDFAKTQIANYCDRKFGIGADGFILIDEGSGEVDFKMRYFNSDGNEATFCGNGTRCAVAFAHFLGLVNMDCQLLAADGVHSATILHHSNQIFSIALKMNDVTKIGRFEDGFFLDTGSPHFVKIISESIFEFDLLNNGKQIRYDNRFPEGCNVNFMQLFNDGIFVRTYERGVEDETLSCGTGVIASAITWALAQKFADGKHCVNVYTKGGNLKVEFDKNANFFSNIYLIGNAVHVFEGKISN